MAQQCIVSYFTLQTEDLGVLNQHSKLLQHRGAEEQTKGRQAGRGSNQDRDCLQENRFCVCFGARNATCYGWFYTCIISIGGAGLVSRREGLASKADIAAGSGRSS